MIAMAQDAYQLKNLDDIMDYDSELFYENKPIYNSETGGIYWNGKIYSTDYNEFETEIIIRDTEGNLINRVNFEKGKELLPDKKLRILSYKNWLYTKEN